MVLSPEMSVHITPVVIVYSSLCCKLHFTAHPHAFSMSFHGPTSNNMHHIAAWYQTTGIPLATNFHIIIIIVNTVGPLYEGHICTSQFVYCREVVHSSKEENVLAL